MKADATITLQPIILDPFKQELARIFTSETDTSAWIDVIVLVTTVIFLYDDSFWLARYKGVNYAFISKGAINMSEIQKDNRLVCYSGKIPVIEDDVLAKEVFTEMMARRRKTRSNES